MSARRNKLWTRERITLALARFVAEYGVDQLKNYVTLARQAGAGLSTHERPYPSDLTVRVEFPTMADAWRAAGVDVPVKHRSPVKTSKRPRSAAFVSAVSPLEAVNARLDAATPRNAKLRSAPVAVAPADPADELRQARADRDLLAEIVAGLLRGDVPPEQVEAMRIGVMVGGLNR